MRPCCPSAPSTKKSTIPYLVVEEKMNKKEMTALQPGTIIQHKTKNEWCFIVSQNFGDRITAVRSIEITDPTEWLEVQKNLGHQYYET
jgi:hypothetical protein